MCTKSKFFVAISSPTMMGTKGLCGYLRCEPSQRNQNVYNVKGTMMCTKSKIFVAISSPMLMSTKSKVFVPSRCTMAFVLVWALCKLTEYCDWRRFVCTFMRGWLSKQGWFSKLGEGEVSTLGLSCTSLFLWFCHRLPLLEFSTFSERSLFAWYAKQWQTFETWLQTVQLTSGTHAPILAKWCNSQVWGYPGLGK